MNKYTENKIEAPRSTIEKKNLVEHKKKKKNAGKLGVYAAKSLDFTWKPLTMSLHQENDILIFILYTRTQWICG